MMLKRVMKRWASLALALVMVVGLLPAMELTASAAEIKNIVEGLDANGAFSEITGGIKVEATSTAFKKASGCGSDTNAASKSASTTLTSTLNVEAKLSFDYTISIEKADGYIKINGDAKTANGHFEQMVKGGATISIEVFSGNPAKDYTDTYTSKVEITNISLAVDKDVTTTFLPAEGGSYTVDGTAVTEIHTHTKNAQETTAMVAAPASGYKFFGWYSETDKTYLSKQANWTTSLTKEQTVKAVFVPSTAPSFQVGAGNEFFDLNEATKFAEGNTDKIVVLVQDGTLPAGDYEIPSGVTLLIPYNDAHTVCTTEPIWHDKDKSASSAKAYKILTMAEGANITVQSGGAISVAARAQNTTPNAGVVLGPWGLIKMETDSAITLESGASLYCWGFITGSGKILAKSGANVYENFQVTTFRGGNASASMNNGAKNKVFPFTQYFVQNVEVPLTFEAGATDNVQLGVTMSYVGLQKGGGTLFGTDEGLFRLTSGTVTKQYDGSTDRLVVEIDGDAQISKMIVNLGLAGDIDSSKFVVPITNNMTVHVKGGHSLAIQEDLALLPGAQVIIDENATLSLASGKNFYIYDQDEWIGKNFAQNGAANFVKVPNAPGRKYDRTDADLADAKVDINGTFTVNGSLYTTTGGANITTSQGIGKVIFSMGAGTGTNTYQVTQSGNSVAAQEVPITPAKLKNASTEANEYSVTAGANVGDIFYYHDGMWDNKSAPEGEHYPHICGETWEKDETNHWNLCTICGTKLNLAAHTWDEGVVTEGKEPTCTEAGEMTFTCTACGQTKTGVADPLGHKFEGDYVQNEDGNTHSRKCVNEGCTAVSEPVTCSATMTQTTAPTCTTPGEKTGTCACGRELKEVVIDEDAHNYVFDTWGNEWTEVNGAWTISANLKCSYNGAHTKTETVTAVKNADQSVAVGHLTDGKDVFTATYGDQTIDHTVDIKAKGHKWSTKWSKDETNHWHECSVCHEKKDNAEHSWVDGDVIENATCYTAGSRKQTCECGATKTAEIPATEKHSFATEWTFDGMDHWHKCTTAGCPAVSDKTAHSYGNPTWTWTNNQATATFTCSCGHSVTVPATVTGKVSQEATCVLPELTVYTAKVTFQETEYEDTTEPVQTKNALDHDMQEVTDSAVAATCTTAGKKADKKCSRCDHTETGKTIEALGHKFSTEFTVDKEATCAEAGSKSRHCSLCDAKTEVTPIEKISHTYGEPSSWTWTQNEETKAWTAKATFTCTKCAEGTEGYTIEVGATISDPVVVPATCVKEGSKTYTATVTFENKNYTCDKTRTTIIEALGHDLKKTEAKDPTCTTEGNKEYWVCQREGCGKLFSDAAGTTETTLKEVTLAAINHKNAVPTSAQAATCTTAGNNAYWTCPDCKKVFKDSNGKIGTETTVEAEALKKLDHDFTVFQNWGEWTAVEGGYTRQAVVKCSRCDATENQNATVTGPATVPSTCKDHGTKTYTSTWGDKSDTKVDTINELAAHTPAEAVRENENPATCAAAGSYDEVVCCTVCKKELSRETKTIAKLTTHTPGEAVEENREEATCAKEGSYDEVVYCSVCKKELSRETKTIAKLTTHTPGEAVEENREEATCAEEGSYDEVVYCSVCHAELRRETKTIAKLTTHTPGEVVEENREEATCAKEGSYDEVVRCTVCNEVINSTHKTIDKLTTHTPAEAVRENVNDSTCTKEGSYDEVVKCSVCGKELSRTPKTIDKKNHTSGVAQKENVVDATCTVAGSWDEVVRCTECKAELSRKHVTGATLAHDWNTTWLTDEDGHWHQCKNCSATTEKVNHNSETVKGTPATCTSVGWTDGEKCSECGKILKEQTKLEMIAHTSGEVKYENEVPATCAAEGHYDEVVYCAVCKNEISREQKKLERTTDHNYQWVIKTPATCGANGEETYTCSVCGATNGTRDIPATGNHNYEESGRIEATYEQDGSVTYTCSACGDFYTEVLPKLSHHWDEGIRTEPTCTEPGSIVHKCNDDGCEETWTETIPATGHTEVTDAAVAATCTETGLTEGKHCSVCNVVILAQQTIPAKGHTEVEIPAVAATCETAGANAGVKCSVCGEILTAPTTIEPLGHSFTNYVSNNDATYDADGTKTAKCDRCEVTNTVTDEGSKLTRPVDPNPPVNPDPGPVGPIGPVNPPVTPVDPTPSPVPSEEPEENLEENDVPLGETPVDLESGLLRLPVSVAGDVVVRADGTIVTKSLVEAEMAYFLLDEPASVRIISNARRFIDVRKDDWFAPAVSFVSSHELFNGVSENEFAPNMAMNRAMMVTVLWRLEGCPQVEGTIPFADVAEGEWYTQAIRWAAQKGIVNGYENGCFGTWDDVTREQIAAILYRYMNVMGLDTEASTELTAYADSEAVSDWAENAMVWAVDRGIINGLTESLLAPQEDAARCQVATMLQRLVTNMVK